jgi:hypothetical protein
MAQASAQEKPTPLFLVGCSRSGTTLLASIMEAKFNLAVPLETHFIPYYSKLLWLWGDLGRRENRQRLVEEIFIFLEIWTARNNPYRSFQESRAVSLLAVKEQAMALLVDIQPFGKMVEKLFELYAEGKNCRHWADNSSYYYLEPMADWDAHLPDMKVIHIIRDGRDVVLSWLNMPFPPPGLANIAPRWVDQVEEKRRWGEGNPDRYLEIYYDDLLEAPETVVERIGEFIDDTPNLEPLNLQNSRSARVLSAGGTHDLLGGGIRKDNREKWKTRMPESEQKFFEYLAGSQLEKLGYPRRFSTFSMLDRGVFRLKKWLLWSQGFFTIGFYMRKAKPILPLLIFFARRLGVAPEFIIKSLR